MMMMENLKLLTGTNFHLMLKSRYLTYQINPAATNQASQLPQMQSQTAHEKKILIDKFSPFYPVIQQFFCVLLTTSDSFFSLFREMGWKKKLVSVQLNCALQSNLENVPQCAFWCVFSSKYVPLESDSIKVTSLIIPFITYYHFELLYCKIFDKFSKVCCYETHLQNISNAFALSLISRQVVLYTFIQVRQFF